MKNAVEITVPLLLGVDFGYIKFYLNRQNDTFFSTVGECYSGERRCLWDTLIQISFDLHAVTVILLCHNDYLDEWIEILNSLQLPGSMRGHLPGKDTRNVGILFSYSFILVMSDIFFGSPSPLNIDVVDVHEK